MQLRLKYNFQRKGINTKIGPVMRVRSESQGIACRWETEHVTNLYVEVDVL